MKRSFATCNKFIEIIGACIIAFIVSVIFYQGVTRYFIGVTFKWTEDITALLLVVIVFAGIGVVEQEDGHIKMDLIYSLFPNLKMHFKLTAYFLTLIFVGFAIYCEITYLPSVKGRTISPTVNFPTSVFHWCMLFGLVYWASSIIFNIYTTFKNKEIKK
jgi:TRAP-type C4-dicarboxylate transport system permease small subunit